jgi:hypothetical protein
VFGRTALHMPAITRSTDKARSPMSIVPQRPPFSAKTQPGVLDCEHFQVAYVTNDAEPARDVFRERYGVRHLAQHDAILSTGAHFHYELGREGGTMLELIEASGAGTEFLNAKLPAKEFAIRFHHFGYLVHGQEAWDSLTRKIATEEWHVPYEGQVSDVIQYRHVYAPELDHYLEYILLGKNGDELTTGVPVIA